MRKSFILTALLLIAAIPAFTLILYVPSQYPTIQAGIDAAVNGDTVLVADGTYIGEGNKDIDFLGRAIVVSSENGPENCIIDCENEGRGFNLHTDEDSTSILNGFTITNGSSDEGSGIRCDNSSPIIENCIITDNTVEDYGGGIYCYYSQSTIRNCVINYNTAGWYGGGLFIHQSDLTVENSDFHKNSAFFAGGIWCEYSDPVVRNCVFEKNSATWDGGGILVGFNSSPVITDCILDSNSAWRGGGLWCHKSISIIRNCLVVDNDADCGGGVFLYWDSENLLENCTISGNTAIADGGGIHTGYCNTVIRNTIVESNTGNGGVFFDQYAVSEVIFGDFFDNENGNFTGTNIPPGLEQIVAVNANGDSCDIYSNIFLDPLFYSTTGDSAFYLTENSPCIDAGDPTFPLDPDFTIADMGAYYYDQTQQIPVIEDLTITIDSLNVILGWSPIPDAESYNIYRSTEPYFDIGGMTPIANVTENQYIDENALTDGPFFYVVTYEY